MCPWRKQSVGLQTRMHMLYRMSLSPRFLYKGPILLSTIRMYYAVCCVLNVYALSICALLCYGNACCPVITGTWSVIFRMSLIRMSCIHQTREGTNCNLRTTVTLLTFVAGTSERVIPRMFFNSHECSQYNTIRM